MATMTLVWAVRPVSHAIIPVQPAQTHQYAQHVMRLDRIEKPLAAYVNAKLNIMMMAIILSACHVSMNVQHVSPGLQIA